MESQINDCQRKAISVAYTVFNELLKVNNSLFRFRNGLYYVEMGADLHLTAINMIRQRLDGESEDQILSVIKVFCKIAAIRKILGTSTKLSS
ncbi:MAG: hypothetical protein ACRCXZ_06260 [Patescibacteria group bacterium]